MKSIFTTLLIVICGYVGAATFYVGASKTYTKPSQVVGLVNDYDTVLIDAGTYSGDACAWYNDHLVIKGVGGYAHLEANGAHSQGKAIWVIAGDSCYIENIEFSGAEVDDHNGAGIRQEGTSVYIKNCYFHDNENGILTTDDANSEVIIDRCEFANNGYGDGYTHNMYINHVKRFVLKYCYTHHSNIGHTVKSRAYQNEILYNRIMDEDDGIASMLIDLPNGGFSVILGNVLMQGPNATNNTLIAYGTEGLSNPQTSIYIVNNTLVNKRQTGRFVFVQSGGSAMITNNIFAGIGTTIDGSATSTYNINYTNISYFHFADENNLDFHLTQQSPGIDSGQSMAHISVYPLAATAEYKHHYDSTGRNDDGTIDIGAFEYEKTNNISQADDFKFTIFPNPCQTGFKIETEEYRELHITITDLEGKVVKDLKKHSVDEVVNLGSLAAGPYFIQIFGQGNKYLHQSLIVKR